jgi:hypothetical protein
MYFFFKWCCYELDMCRGGGGSRIFEIESRKESLDLDSNFFFSVSKFQNFPTDTIVFDLLSLTQTTRSTRIVNGWQRQNESTCQQSLSLSRAFSLSVNGEKEHGPWDDFVIEIYEDRSGSGLCERGDEPPGSIKCWEVLE